MNALKLVEEIRAGKLVLTQEDHDLLDSIELHYMTIVDMLTPLLMELAEFNKNVVMALKHFEEPNGERDYPIEGGAVRSFDKPDHPGESQGAM